MENIKFDENNDKKILYDWVSISSKMLTVEEFKNILGMSHLVWQELTGRFSYSKRVFCENVSIHYDSKQNSGVWLEMTGQGCRIFETLGNGDYESLFNIVRQNPETTNLTRLDIAYDDKGGSVLPLPTLLKDTEKQNFVSKWNEYEYISGSKGTTLYFGSIHSAIRLRIYDKARERGFDKDMKWVRAELQLRDQHAYNFINLDLPVGEKYIGVINNYIRFINPDKSRKYNCTIKPYWQKFIGNASKIKIYTKPGMQYNLMNLHRHVLNGCGGSILTMIQVFGEDKFLDLIKNHSKITNPRHIKVLTDVQNFYELKDQLDNDYTMKQFFYDEFEVYRSYIENTNMLTELDIEERNKKVIELEGREVSLEQEILEQLEFNKKRKQKGI